MTRDTYAKTIAALVGAAAIAFGLDADNEVLQAIGVLVTGAGVFFLPK